MVQAKPLDTVQRQPIEEEEEEETVQSKPASGNGRAPHVSPSTASRVNNLRGRGQPLRDSARRYFEPRFDVDFSGVRIHHDAEAAAAAQSINARAFTIGHDIVFNHQTYKPGEDAGRRLLAHELTHAVQQRAATRRPLDPSRTGIGAPGSRGESATALGGSRSRAGLWLASPGTRLASGDHGAPGESRSAYFQPHAHPVVQRQPAAPARPFRGGRFTVAWSPRADVFFRRVVAAVSRRFHTRAAALWVPLFAPAHRVWRQLQRSRDLHPRDLYPGEQVELSVEYRHRPGREPEVRDLYLGLPGTQPAGEADRSVPVINIPDATELNFYDINGRTVQELREAMNQQGPIDHAGDRSDADTRWNITWQWGAGGPSTAVAKIDYIRVTFPRWNPPEDAQTDVIESWRNYIQILARHEGNHVQFVHGELPNIQAAVRQGATEADADEAGNAALEVLRQRDLDYDRDTRHGATEGAVFG